MNKIFKFNTNELRTIQVNDEPYFCLKDVCQILELNNVSQVKTRLNESGIILNEVGVTTGETFEGIPTYQNVMMNFINESNLYRVILQSRKKIALSFQDWVVEDVLPEIRKTGSYGSSYQKKSSSAGEVASLLKIIVPAMKAQGSSKEDIMKQIQLTCNQFGIQTISNLVKAPTYKQLTIAIVDDE